jgi:hypothetical protein
LFKFHQIPIKLHPRSIPFNSTKSPQNPEKKNEKPQISHGFPTVFPWFSHVNARPKAMSKHRPGTTTVEAGTLAPQVNSFPAVTQANLFLTKATAKICRFHGDFMVIEGDNKKGIFLW